MLTPKYLAAPENPSYLFSFVCMFMLFLCRTKYPLVQTYQREDEPERRR
jgi:hypothetical protein